ncbi:MAG: F0F1 ATP synthase subunit B family protein [Planctomycetota bacterium]|jgi:F-type H+-transporting ATPase subunit b
MQNTWITFSAQIVNFLVLVILLRYLLYGRILGAMKKREDGIADNIEEARKMKADAEKEAGEFREKSDELDSKRRELMTEAAEEAKMERKKLIDAARAEADEMGARWKKSVEQERDAFFHELQKRMSSQLCSVAASALTDMAGADLEAKMIDVFIDRLKKLPEDEKRGFAKSVKEAGREISVTSAFQIPDAKVSEIRELVGALADMHVNVVSRRSESIICGIEISAGGSRFEWTMESYVESLEEDLGAAIDETVMRAGTADAQEKAQ